MQSQLKRACFHGSMFPDAGGLVNARFACRRDQCFIPRLIEFGLDLLDPIQPVGPDKQPRALKVE
jgi:hypothetical protein